MASKSKRKKETSEKEETDNPDGDDSQTPEQPVAEEEEPHETSSFKWRWEGKLRTCNKAGTVEESLQADLRFKTIADRNQEKELVILRYGKAIIPDFPCSLMKECNELRVRYIKACGKPRGPGELLRKAPSVNALMFHIQTRGGKKVPRIMRSPELETQCVEVTVYAFKGQTVEEALRRDGRFLEVIFDENCVLHKPSDDSETPMSILVDDLNDKSFQIIMSTSDSDPPQQVTEMDVEKNLDEFYSIIQKAQLKGEPNQKV